MGSTDFRKSDRKLAFAVEKHIARIERRAADVSAALASPDFTARLAVLTAGTPLVGRDRALAAALEILRRMGVDTTDVSVEVSLHGQKVGQYVFSAQVPDDVRARAHAIATGRRAAA